MFPPHGGPPEYDGVGHSSCYFELGAASRAHPDRVHSTLQYAKVNIMFKVRINPHWEITRGNGEPLDTAVLLSLLRAIDESGSIARAAQTVGLSYRYAWGLLRGGGAVWQ